LIAALNLAPVTIERAILILLGGDEIEMQPLVTDPVVMRLSTGSVADLQSFFEMNTTDAEVIFAHIAECAAVDEQTLIVGCCCGTGVVALSMAKQGRCVFRIDIDTSAISDATGSAELNRIENAEFIVGKVEDQLAPLPLRQTGISASVCLFPGCTQKYFCVAIGS
jgi:tRNA/tmRNA/rRNA uracil-C5-methylase (TrmA/RlmC/RlmD family)